MATQPRQPTWDPTALAGQFQNIAKQSQALMQRFVSNQTDATNFGMGDTSTLGFDFADLMAKLSANPIAVAKAQIDLFNDNLAVWQKTTERMFSLRSPEAVKSKDKRFKHPDWTENAVFDFVKESYLVAAKSIFRQSETSRDWTRLRPERSTSIRASTWMRCHPPTSLRPIQRSSPPRWNQADRTCCAV